MRGGGIGLIGWRSNGVVVQRVQRAQRGISCDRAIEDREVVESVVEGGSLRHGTYGALPL